MKYSFSYFEIPDDLYSFCYENFNNLKEEKKQLLLKRENLKQINNNNSCNRIKKENKNLDYKVDNNKLQKENKNISNNRNYIQFKKDKFYSITNKNNDYKITSNTNNFLNVYEPHLLNDKKNNQITSKENKALFDTAKDKRIKYHNALFFKVNNKEKYIKEKNNDKLYSTIRKEDKKNIFIRDKKISSIKKQYKNIAYHKLKDVFFNYTVSKNIQINKSSNNRINNTNRNIKINTNNISNKNIHKISVNINSTFNNNKLKNNAKNLNTYEDKCYSYKTQLENINVDTSHTDQCTLKKNILNLDLYDTSNININTLQKDDTYIANSKIDEKTNIVKDFSSSFINIEGKETRLNKFYNKQINEIQKTYKNKYLNSKNQKGFYIDKKDTYFKNKEYNKKINKKIKTDLQFNKTNNKNINNENFTSITYNNIHRIGEKKINKENDLFFDKYSIKYTNITDREIKNGILQKNVLKHININQNIISSKIHNKKIDIIHNGKKLNSTPKNIYIEDKERLSTLYKRLWFIKGIGDIDYKILPNTDYKYPAPINIFVEKPNFEYYFEYKTFCDEYFNGEYIIELYDYDYNTISVLKTNNVEEKEISNDIISLKISKENFNDMNTKEKEHYKFEINISYPKVNYVIIRQPTNTFDNEVLYTVTEKFLGENKHPIPFGNELGLREIPIHINIMVEFINVLLLLWQQRFVAFGGLLGIHGIYGLVNLVYEWLTLETSIENNEYIEEYNRCFRWLRWEAEKTYNLAKADTKLNANNWINFMINEMIDYVEMHHIDVIPILKNIMDTDDWRNKFSDATSDIKIILDKMKGKRKRIVSNKKIELTNKPLNNLK